MIIKRGDVWLAMAGGRSGGLETRHARPFVVVSPPELHDHLRTVIVAPVATGRTPAPFRPALRVRGERALLLLDQLHTIDKSSLIRRVAALTPATLNGVLTTLEQTFAP